MVASIESIKGLISAKRGLARPNAYAVVLPSFPGATSREVNLLCTNVNLPGRQVLTYDHVIGNRREKVAYGAASEDLSLSFLLLNDYGVKRYFEEWARLAFDPDTYQIGYKNEYARDIQVHQLQTGVGLPVYSTPLGIPTLPSNVQNRLPTVGPFDLAQGQFDLDFLTPAKIVYSCKMFEAFPTTIESIPLTNELDGIVEFRVQLSYTKWQSTFNQIG